MKINDKNIFLGLFSIFFVLLYFTQNFFFTFFFLTPLFLYLKKANKFESTKLIILFIILGIINFSYFSGFGIVFLLSSGLLMALFFLPITFVSYYLLKGKYYLFGIPAIFYIVYEFFTLIPTSNFWFHLIGFFPNIPFVVTILGAGLTTFILILINLILFELIINSQKNIENSKVKNNNFNKGNNKSKKNISYKNIFRENLNKKNIILIFLFFLLLGILAIPITKNNYNQYETLNVVGIQGNIDQDWYTRAQLSRTNLIKYINLTETALETNKKVDIVIWPEYVFTHLLELDFELLNFLENYSYSNNITLIVGSLLLDDINSQDSKRYNSLYIFNQKNLTHYNAYEPVLLFDEHAKRAEKNQEQIFHNTSLGLTLCFEENFPYIFNQYSTQKNAEMYFVIGNQYFIKNKKGLELTSIASKLRAVETQKFVFRLETSGLSAVYSPKGEIKKRLEINTDDFLYYEIPKISNITFYSKYYFILEKFFLLLSILILLLIFFKFKVKK